MLIYDPLVTSQGSLSLRAYRLSDKFMRICRQRNFTPHKSALDWNSWKRSAGANAL